MSSAKALDFGKVIFNVLKTNSTLLSVVGMSANKIQPTPMLEQGDPTIGVLYEISAVNPINAKRVNRSEITPLYIVDFSIQAFSTDYSTSVILAKAVINAFHDLPNGVYEFIKVDGINLQTISEDYNKAQRYYNKAISFQARVLG
tara:strand:- start:1136 stop:1570 length:435 start_codon:yes stop_codon:yes gene_type:complete